MIKEISKAEFEEQGEDYIILKTSQLALASQLIQDQLHHRIKVIDKDGEIHIFGQTHDIKVIVKALVQQILTWMKSTMPAKIWKNSLRTW